MAVSVPHYLVVRDLYRYGMLPQGGSLLEIGEANWYGDIMPLSMIDDIQRFVTDPVRRDAPSRGSRRSSRPILRRLSSTS